MNCFAGIAERVVIEYTRRKMYVPLKMNLDVKYIWMWVVVTYNVY